MIYFVNPPIYTAQVGKRKKVEERIGIAEGIYGFDVL